MKTMNNQTTVWAVQNLLQMSKAQLAEVWGRQERLTWVECMQPKTKAAFVRSILSWQEARGL